MATKAKTRKGTKATAKAATFKPAKDVNIFQRGAEFEQLVQQGMSLKEIEVLYRKHGIEFSTPTYFNARRIASAPKFVQAAIGAGKVTASDVLPLLKGRRALGEKKWNAQLKEGIASLIAQRRQKVLSLEQAGVIESGSGKRVKMTTLRTIKLVGARLAEIRKSGPIKSARAAVLADLVKGLQDGLTAEELLTTFGVKAKA